jgi:hypothetical protein
VKLVLVLPVVLFTGLATYIRIIDARIEDFWLVSGMNRLRHAYLENAPGLEPYFVTGITTITKACTRRTGHAPRSGSTACSPARP